MPHRLIGFVSAVTVLAWATVASAQQIWTASGFVGSVDEADTAMHVFGSNGAVAIKSAVRGTLNLRYPVQTLPDLLVPQEGDCPEMRVNLRDTGAGARVIVRLMQLEIFPAGPGHVRQLASLGEIDSDTRQPSGDANEYRSYAVCLKPAPDTVFGPGTGEFITDYAFNTYFVDVQLIKSTATANPGLLSLQICPSQDACDP